jgi:Holliday junction resolvasome RuvABC endonuclease subunit
MIKAILGKAILGIDVGYCYTGCAVAIPQRGGTYRWIRLDCIATKPEKKKRGIRVADDNFRRCQQIYRELAGIISRIEPVLAGFALELPHGGSMSASAAAAMGRAAAVVACAVERTCLPAECITPQENKRALCGIANASKAQMVAAARELLAGSGCELHGPQQHVQAQADAVGAAWAIRHGDLFRRTSEFNEAMES